MSQTFLLEKIITSNIVPETQLMSSLVCKGSRNRRFFVRHFGWFDNSNTIKRARVGKGIRFRLSLTLE